MKIAIYNNGIPFNGHTPENGPLGGSESGIVYMARELSRQGHEMTVYSNCPDPGVYDGVDYRHYHLFFNEFQSTPWDVFISFRSFDPFLVGRIAPRMLFWTGDAHDQPAIRHLGHPAIQGNVDYLLCVSEWQRRTFIDRFDLPEAKVIATRNGFASELAPAPSEKIWTQGVYSSTPFRGLAGLLEMFPDIRRRVPEMTLDIFSSMKVYGWSEARDREAYGGLYTTAGQPGVNLRGSVAQTLLLEHMSRSGFLLYPNTFEETSCIAAIEAQACGAVVVTSAKAGLKETVDSPRTGICISGDTASREYRRQFVETVAELAANPERMRKMSAAARKRAMEHYAWSVIATEWTFLFEEMETKPVSRRWAGPLMLLDKGHQYLAKGNRSAVAQVLGRLEAMPFFEGEVRILREKLEDRRVEQADGKSSENPRRVSQPLSSSK